MQKPSVKTLIKVIEAKRGNLSAVAREFDRPRSTVQSWIEASSTAMEALHDSREMRVDVAEHVVYKATAKENLSAAFYILNNDPIAKRRGWGQRLELTGNEGGEIIIKVVNDR